MKNKNFILYCNDKFLYNISYKQLRVFCKENGLIMDNMLRTLPNYPNERRKNKSYRGYRIIEQSEKDLGKENIKEENKQSNKVDKIVLNSDRKEIDFVNGKIRAEKLIHLNIDNINERDILNEFNLDIKEWQIEKLNYSLWDSPNKEKGSIPLYSVKCSFKRRDRLDYDIESLKAIIDNVLTVKNDNIKIEKFENVYDRVLLINIADLHLNKYSSDYNINEAKDRYSKALDFFISESNAEKCILIVGEDFFNIDTINRTTTKGTPQDTEVDVYKMFEEGLQFLKEKINLLSYNFSFVEVILIQGNHDKLLSYALVKALEQCNYTDNNVEFNSTVSNRKYITIGNSLIGLGHLDNENKKQKPFLMQNEVKEKYGKSKYNYFISGHFHNYSVEDIGGIQYIRLPSLSGKDNWHDEVGFITSNKSAMALEFDKEKGLVNKIIYNINV